VTRYVVTLSDESTCAVDADRVDVVDGGALVFAVADTTPPDRLREIFILSARSWRWCEAADAGVSWSNAAEQAKPSKVLGQAQIPDQLRRSGW
jgi:hypothetical protein